MFDYQAGEKYKLTLIMVGVVGVVIGASLTLFLASPGEAPPPNKRGHGRRMASNVEGGSGGLRAAGGRMSEAGYGAPAQATPTVEKVDGGTASAFVQTFLPNIWDFSSSTAAQSQARAMAAMTPECAQNYKSNVWTDQLAQQVAGAGMTSSFTATSCQFLTNTDDGSAVIKVEGEQILNLQSQPPQNKHVIMEYLVKKTPEGLKVSGISESGNFGS